MQPVRSFVVFHQLAYQVQMVLVEHFTAVYSIIVMEVFIFPILLV